MAALSLSRRLSRLLGADSVSTDPAVLAAHASDKWFASREPEVVVFARTTEQVSKLMKFAHRHGLPVTPRGAGYGYVGGCVPARGGTELTFPLAC